MIDPILRTSPPITPAFEGVNYSITYYILLLLLYYINKGLSGC